MEDIVTVIDEIVNLPKNDEKVKQRPTPKKLFDGAGDGNDNDEAACSSALAIRKPGPSVFFAKADSMTSTRYSYPLLYVSPCGTVSVLFRQDVFVEMTVDKTIRVLCPGKFSAATNGRGTASCIMHPQARILQAETHVYCEFEDEKLAVFGSQGIIFTMKSLPTSYLVSSTMVNGTTPIPSHYVTYPALRTDFTMNMLYVQSVCGDFAVPQCNEIVKNAKYSIREDGTITLIMNGVFIKQHRNGDLIVNSRPRSIRASPSKSTIFVRTHYVDMGVQENSKGFVKRGVKRIHVSRSGMVVSDGNCITSMDHFGRIVSST